MKSYLDLVEEASKPKSMAIVFTIPRGLEEELSEPADREQLQAIREYNKLILDIEARLEN